MNSKNLITKITLRTDVTFPRAESASLWSQAVSAHLNPPHSSSVSIQLSSWFWDPPAHIHYVTLLGQVGLWSWIPQLSRVNACQPSRETSDCVPSAFIFAGDAVALNSRQTSPKNKRHFKTVDSDAVTSRWLVTCQTDVVSPGTSEWEFGFSNTLLSISLPTDINRGHAKSTSRASVKSPWPLTLTGVINLTWNRIDSLEASWT